MRPSEAPESFLERLGGDGGVGQGGEWRRTRLGPQSWGQSWGSCCLVGGAARFEVRPETRLAATTNGKSVTACSLSCHRGGRGLEEESRAERGDAPEQWQRPVGSQGRKSPGISATAEAQAGRPGHGSRQWVK